jgi:hypothetical protein
MSQEKFQFEALDILDLGSRVLAVGRAHSRGKEQAQDST